MLTPIVLSALLAAPALAQAPPVSLLTDLPQYTTKGDIHIRDLLPLVQLRKLAPFRFGSTHDVFSPASSANWTSNIFKTVFNHVVAENGCKWYDTEPQRNVSTLGDCQGVSQYAAEHLATFRGHNTFWHSQTPSWLPGNVTADDLVKNVIPEHVSAQIKGLGPNVTSWDVTNELIGDSTTWDMDALQCIQSKDVWPTVTSDGSSTPLVQDLSFVHAAFSTALKSAGPFTKLVYNDYSTGANDTKTECVFKLLADINKNASVPYNRLAVGFQSHVTAKPYYFVNKNDLKNTFGRLANLGVDALVTEIDIALVQNTTADFRYQAAIWGDTLDACLYSSNCHEFVNWDTRDDESWITPNANHIGLATLFDATGAPKLAAYELQARFARFIAGKPEVCATALGNSTCTVTA